VSDVLHFRHLTSEPTIIDFKPSAVMFSPSQWGQIIISDVGVLLWLVALYYSINTFGLFEVFRTYFVTYLWCVKSASFMLFFSSTFSQG